MMELMTRCAACAVTSYLLLLATQFTLVKSAYPKCQDLNEIQASWIKTSEDYPSGSAIIDCRKACKDRSDSTTLAGVRKNGDEAGKAACYCGDADVSLVSGCGYDCEGDRDNCGGRDTVSVYTVCDPGNYSPDCSLPCPGNCADNVCDIDSCQCNGQCQDQWHGSDCSLTCSHCGSDSCNKDTGECDGGCDPGWYTPECNKECSPNCAQTSCNIDGKCDDGCTDGWYGAHCNMTCPQNCDGGCEKSSGDCARCKPGSYGSRCEINCPVNCNQTVCDFMSGVCSFGCNDGYHNNKCNSQCPSYCHDNVCEFQTGHCSHGCEEGFYGSEFCEMICPENCAGNVCDNVDGDCNLGCETGWNGSRCDSDVNECIDESSNVCGDFSSDYTCYNTQGSFVCCDTEFDVHTGICIKKSNDSSNTPVWVWPVLAIAVLAVGALGFVGGFLFWSRRQNSPEHRKFSNADSSSSGQQNFGNVNDNSEENNGSLPRKIYVNDGEEQNGPTLPERRNQLHNVVLSHGRPTQSHHDNVINRVGNNGDLSRGTYVNDKEDVSVEVRLSDGYEEYEGKEQPVSVYDELEQQTSWT